MKTKDSTSWIFHWQPTRRTAVKSDREKNQGASEAKELIPKGQNLAGDLCARSSRAEAGPVHQEKDFT
jgi:hypothetical protein